MHRYAAHCAGAVLFAIGAATEVISQPDAAGSLAGKAGQPRRPALRRWPALAPYLVRTPDLEACANK